LFWSVFIISQFAIWHHLQRRLPRGMGNRNLIVHLVIPSGLSSLFMATLVAAGLTLLAILVVRLVLAPILSSWLTPTVDPTSVQFHVAPGEVPLASMQARWRTGWSWQPGALVVTDRRIWFLPTAWDLEPWSVSRSEIAGCEAELPAMATLVPIRNWPPHVRLGMRDGGQRVFATASPLSLMAWCERDGNAGSVALPSRALGQGVFDV